MKCAMELITVADRIAKEREELALLKALEEKEKRRKYTLQECELMGEQLERLAYDGKTPHLSFECDDGGMRLKDGTRYADGRMGQTRWGNELDFETLKEWFENYCFSVTFKEMVWWCYGCGAYKGYLITIEPAPQC